MRTGVDGAARVVGVDDDDTDSLAIGEIPDLIEINLPVTVGQQIVVTRLDVVDLACGLVGWESGTGKENVATLVS